MPGPAKTWGENLLKAVNEKKISIEMIDDKVKRILNVLNFSKTI
jgi:beta-glucosidase-like glycosyl hydrolase